MKWKWVIVGIVAVILIFFIWRSIKSENIFFDKVELNDNNFIRNNTKLKYLDTILKVGLDVLEMDGVIVFARPLTIKSDGDIEYQARIIAGESNNQYLMEIDKSNKGDIIGSISHELIHLQQYRSGNLTVTKDYVIWKGDTLVDNIPDYFDRPWEIEAVNEGRVLERQIRDILYP